MLTSTFVPGTSVILLNLVQLQNLGHRDGNDPVEPYDGQYFLDYVTHPHLPPQTLGPDLQDDSTLSVTLSFQSDPTN